MSQPTLTIRLRLSTIPTYQRKKLSFYSPYPTTTLEHKKDKKDIHNSSITSSNSSNSSNNSDNVTKTQKSKKKKSHKKASKQPTWRSERMGKTTKLLLQKNK